MAKARQSRDEQWTANRELRGRINQLRRERILFLARQHEGERKVQSLQVEIDEIVETAQLYLQERGYVVEEVQQLLGEDMNEDWTFDQRWQELGQNMAREQAKLGSSAARGAAFVGLRLPPICGGVSPTPPPPPRRLAASRPPPDKGAGAAAEPAQHCRPGAVLRRLRPHRGAG